MKKITYLVDTENINTSWINIFKQMNRQDQMMLFYTENTPYLSYEYMNDLLRLERKPEMIRCKTGRNALDFQLVSHLGYLIHTDKTRKYVIVTKDKAYSVVAEYWTEKGFQVACCTPEQLEEKQESKQIPEEQEQKQNEIITSAMKNAEPQQDKIMASAMEKTEQPKEKKTKFGSRQFRKNNTKKQNGKSAKELDNRKTEKKIEEKTPKTSENEKQQPKAHNGKKKKQRNIRAELGELLPKEWKKQDKALLPELEKMITEDEKLDKKELHNKLIRKLGAEKGGQLYQILKNKIDKLYEK
ncbi:MAG: PIN domain-containing protein [Roseburia porci]|nr:PIN domain-containing protein [Roseburia porci]